MPSSDLPDIVVVGAASRDRVEDDPRGWRLGGAVSYAALAIARLGLRVGALVGADAEAATARELDLLREAGLPDAWCIPPPPVDLELAVDLAQVELDRLRREAELGGDLLVRPAFGDEVGHAALSEGEHAVR